MDDLSLCQTAGTPLINNGIVSYALLFFSRGAECHLHCVRVCVCVFITAAEANL